MKILLIDDDAFLRDMYVTKFTEAGHTVAVASSGKSGLLEIAEHGPFDAVVLDMVMPGMTGIEILQAIQKDYAAAAGKCIVLSNQGEQKDQDAARSAGAAGYIVKAELVPSEVVAQVEAIVNA